MCKMLSQPWQSSTSFSCRSIRLLRPCTTYTGTGRRFDLRGEALGVAIVDDYAHHPTQIRTTLAAARGRFPGRRLWAVWQPHTYSRTQALLPSMPLHLPMRIE